MLELKLPPENHSWVTALGLLDADERKFLKKHLPDDDLEKLVLDWRYKLRREQFAPPGAWDVWYLNTGRGWGKTLAGSWNVNELVDAELYGRVALVGPTAADVRDTMVEGPTGLLATASRDNPATYFPSLRKVQWKNGAEAHLYACFTDEDTQRLRGPQHDLAWCDELAAWRHLSNAWDMLQIGLRLGSHPRTIVTTTPKPRKLLKAIRDSDRCIVQRGTTFDNIGNLAPTYRKKLMEMYDGTRLGRQELYAEDLEEAEGALWNRDLLEETRVPLTHSFDPIRIVVGVDPAATKNADSDEVGIVIGAKGRDGHCYILEDISRKMTPGETCKNAVDAFDLWSADRIVAEANNGGDWIELGIRQVRHGISYKKLHASRSKQARAEPVAALFEQKRAHIVGAHPLLEDELCAWEPDSGMASPNRLDAMVWVVTELMLGGRGARMLKVRGF
jgi:phage terminase large subunit-like protein